MAEIICPKLTINGVETNEYNGQTIKQIHYNNDTYVLQTTPTYDPILENNTWETIKSACEAGDAILSTWLGQTKSTTHKGIATSFRLVDTYVGRYKFSDNSDNHAVFEMTNTTYYAHQYNTTKNSIGGYAGCSIKNSFDTSIYNSFPSDLQAILKNTQVKSTIGGNASSIVTAYDCKLFPTGISEITGNSTYSGETNGGQFSYYVGKSKPYTKYNMSNNNQIYYGVRSPLSSSYQAIVKVYSPDGSFSNGFADGYEVYPICFAL